MCSFVRFTHISDFGLICDCAVLLSDSSNLWAGERLYSNIWVGAIDCHFGFNREPSTALKRNSQVGSSDILFYSRLSDCCFALFTLERFKHEGMCIRSQFWRNRGQGRFYLIHIWPSQLKSLSVAFLRRVKQVMSREQRDLPGVDSEESEAPSSGSEASEGDFAQLSCVGCGIGSNAENPIIKERKQRKGKVLWGKTTTRRFKKKGKKVKKKMACGEWCRVCNNMVRKEVKRGKYKKAEQRTKGDGKRLIKDDIKKLGPERTRWRHNNKEWIHLKNGGRSRVNSFSETVKVKDEKVHEIKAPRKQFDLLKKYKDKFGDPKKNKAKVVSKTVPGKGKQKGVYVLVGEEGIYDVVDKVMASAAKESTRNNGEEVLHADEIGEDYDEARHRFPHVSKYFSNADNDCGCSFHRYNNSLFLSKHFPSCFEIFFQLRLRLDFECARGGCRIGRRAGC